MKQASKPEYGRELSELCITVRELVEKGAFGECEKLIAAAMGKYPHAPHPHNLIGILYEKMGDQHTAVKHFRAAWALDPTYLAARCNLDRYASFDLKESCVYDDTDWK